MCKIRISLNVFDNPTPNTFLLDNSCTLRSSTLKTGKNRWWKRLFTLALAPLSWSQDASAGDGRKNDISCSKSLHFKQSRPTASKKMVPSWPFGRPVLMLNQNPKPLMCLVPSQASHLTAPNYCEKKPFPFCLRYLNKSKRTETEQG